MPEHAGPRRKVRAGVLTLVAAFVGTGPVRGQIAGQNVNMVSGTGWPGGDPFLQRQNEPSLAVSSRNPLHLLAGANDYRTVDIPNPNSPDETGDAWLGIFKSFDGGQTWQSTLLPGYPQDRSPLGLGFPLHGFSAAADPVVRSGTNGLFYYSGIAFNRGTNLGAVFVSTLIDLDNKENGDAAQGLDPIKLVGARIIDTGTAGQFLDKPWVSADLPRAGAGQCTIGVSPTQSFPAGNVYLAYAKFTGSNSTKIMFTRSLDCGNTWSTPAKLSESNSVNQGTTIAIDPTSGAVYVAWRRFATSSQTDAVMVVRSTDFGQTFTKATTAASITPFDQGDTTTSFRTESLPTLAVSVDAASTSRVHLAWAGRASAGADARIYLSTSLDGLTWSNPSPVDSGPVTDDFGAGFTRGHQFMPQLTFAAGQLMLLYYDTRLDHTLGLSYPNNPFVPDNNGRFYLEQRALRGELLTNPSQVYTPYVDDSGLTLWRHTIDVRVAQAAPSSSPAFTTTRVSQYPFGTRGDETGTIQYLQQLQVDPPDLPLFAQGTLSFIGDYIDIAGQTFTPPAVAGGPWTYNLARAAAPVFYATWTSNQDVRPPLDGDWTHYTPVGGGGTSVYDSTQSTPSCTSGQEGMRNQNIYSARVTQGLQVTSPQNTKPLSSALTRAFVILVRNATALDRYFQLTIANQPVGGKASFLLHPGPGDPDPLTTLNVGIPARSGIARSVFATSTNPVASITVNVNEADPLGNPVPGGLSSFVVLNPDATAPTLTNPDGSPAGTDISTIEIYTPNVSNPNVSNPNVSNPNVSNPNVSNPNVSNPNVSNPNVSNPDLANPNVSNPNVSNPNVSNPNVSNPNVSNPNISNQSISDATYTVTNSGNTSASYHVKLVGNAPANVQLQLIVTKVYQTPISINCQLKQQQQGTVLANIESPVIQDPSSLTDPDITDPSFSNTTFSLRPGEQALVTLRGYTDLATMQGVTSQVAPVLIPHAAPTFAAPLFVATGALPDPTFGTPYSQTLTAIGGTAPYGWSVSSGTLPAGLSLSAGGQLTGTPTAIATATFTVQVSDSSTPASAISRSLSLTVDQAATSTSLVSSANPSVVGQTVTFTATVAPASPATGTPTGNVTFRDGSTTLGTVALASGSAAFSAPALALGSHSITASYGGDGHFLATASPALSQVVGMAGTTTSVTSSASPAVLGQPVTFAATVSVSAPGSGVPSGSVTFLDGNATLGTAALAGGSATFTTAGLTLGTHSITASYGGDANFLASASTALSQLVNKGVVTVAVTSSVNPSVFGRMVAFTATVTAAPPAIGAPTGTVTFSDGGTTLGTATLSAGVAGIATSALATGGHSITATYGGDGNFTSTVSGALAEVVNRAATTTALASSANPSSVGQVLTFIATVAAAPPGSGTPTGTVTFLDGSTALGSASLSGGVASFTTSALSGGGHSITASYGGDGNFLASASGVLGESVTYLFVGYLSPLATAGTSSSPTYSGSFKLGKAIPVKWQLKDSSGNYVPSLGTARLLQAVKNVACPGVPGVQAIVLYSPTSGATGNSTFRYDTTNNQFIFNWDTSSTAGLGTGCYTLVLQLSDGSAARATIVQLN